jgi:hypothetical protein
LLQGLPSSLLKAFMHKGTFRRHLICTRSLWRRSSKTKTLSRDNVFVFKGFFWDQMPPEYSVGHKSFCNVVSGENNEIQWEIWLYHRRILNKIKVKIPPEYSLGHISFCNRIFGCGTGTHGCHHQYNEITN